MGYQSLTAADRICWALVGLILAYGVARAWIRSDDRSGLVKRWAISLVLILIIFGILYLRTPMKYLLFIVPLTALAFLWLPSWMNVVLAPILGAMDGSNEEVEAKAYYFAAEGLRRRGLFSEAIAEVRRQLEQFPGDYEGYTKLATIQAECLKDLPTAEATLNEFLEIPGHTPNQIVSVLHLLADWQLQYGRGAQAAADTLQRIDELFPGTPMAHAAAQRLAHLATADETRRVRHESRFTVTQGRADAGLRNEPSAAPAVEDPYARADEYVKQLAVHPFDTETREKLAVLYAEDFQRLDLAVDQLEQLIALPSEPPKHIARWLNLLATLHVKHAHDREAAAAALRRITERFPGGALSTMAVTRLATLDAELKAGQRAAPKALGIYEKDVGLKRAAG